ncbi:MAG: LytR/AlgR family response regulator transcription factor [Saprospiraceae bacterium]
MRCIIVDDEPLAREGMELNVDEVNYLELVGQFANALRANEFMQQNDVDLMFLDIQMPGITGLEFLKSLKNRPLVILTTAYPQYALEGFDLDVVDYLVKPIRLQRFIKAVNKAKELHDLYQQTAAAPATTNTVEEMTEDYIYIKSDRKYVRIFYQDIRFIKGLKDYVTLYLADGRKLMTAMNIKTIHNQLPPKVFARVNKSFIININFIDAIETDFILLKGEEIPLGRTYKEQFITKYVKSNFIGRK